MFGVPRVWEKLHAGVMGALAADPEKAAQFNGAVEAAKPLVEAIDWGDGHRGADRHLRVPGRRRLRQRAGA